MEAGHDPVKLLEQKKAANKYIYELYEKWLTTHADTLKPKTKKDMIALWKNYVLPKIGKQRVNDIDSNDIEDLLRPIQSIYAANKVLALLSKAFNLAEKWKMRPLNSNPCKHIKKHKEHVREEMLSNEQFAALLEACDYFIHNGSQYENLSSKAIKCIMLTGARRNEILHAKWEYFNELHGLLHLPDSKTGAKKIALPQDVVDIINSIPRYSDYIFQSTTKEDSPIYDVKYVWAKIKQRAGVKPDLRVHDLRHNFASRLASLGVTLHQVGELLGHTQANTTKRYAHFFTESKREVATRVLEGVKQQQ